MERSYRVERISHNVTNCILTLVNGDEVSIHVTDEKWIGGEER